MTHRIKPPHGRRPVRPPLRARRLRRRASSRGSTTAPTTRSSSGRSRRSRTSSTAAPPAPTPTPATARGSCMQMPDALLPRRSSTSSCRRRAATASAMCFLPHDAGAPRAARALLELNVAREGQRVLGWRDVPVDEAHVGEHRRRLAPAHPPAVRRRRPTGCTADQDAFERKLYVIRRICELAAGPGLLRRRRFSSRTLVYKGMLIAPQLRGFYPDLRDERFASALALVHSRFSTNTFPSWELAHPYRMIAHNGEINTLRGNVNWMRARESQLRSRAVRRRPAEGHAGRAARAARTRRRSTTCSSC